MKTKAILSLFLLGITICASAQSDGSFNNLTANKFQLGGDYQSHTGWSVNTANLVDVRPNATGQPVYVINNHHGLTFSAHSYYGGIRFYNQAYPASPLDVMQGATMVMSIINGNVGIGTTAPVSKLEIGGSAYTNYENSGFIVDAGGLKRVGLMKYPGREGGIWRVASHNFEIGRTNVSSLENAPTTFDTDLFISGDGKVGIGTTSPDYKLAVNGDIGAKKVKVTQSNWPDYVFDSSYKLQPLATVEKFIQQHKHLPDVPSALEVEQNGVDLGDNQAALLKKIEELTLHLIEQNKRIEELEAAVKSKNKKKK